MARYARARRQAIRFLQRSERIGHVQIATHPEDGHFGLRQIDRRIPQRQPFSGDPRAKLAKRRRPERLFAQESATVDRSGKLETLVDPRGNAGQIATPGDARQPDLLGVDVSERPQQGIRQHDVGHGVIGPLIFDRQVDSLKLGVDPRVRARRPAVIETLLSGLVGRHAGTASIHGNRGITTLVPEPHPVGMSGTAPAVDQHHPGHLAPRRMVGQTEPGENAGWLAAQWETVVKDSAHTRLADRRIAEMRRHGQRFGVPMDRSYRLGDGRLGDGRVCGNGCGRKQA